MKVQYTAEIQGPSYEVFRNSVANVVKEFALQTFSPSYPNGLELVGPKGVVSLADIVKTGNAWVYGDNERATVTINFYLVDGQGLPVFGNDYLVFPDGAADSRLDTGSLWAAAYPLQEVIPDAWVNKLNGNKNELFITVTELYPRGAASVVYEAKILIDNNAAGTYQVGPYKVYVDTKGNTQIRACYIVK